MLQLGGLAAVASAASLAFVLLWALWRMDRERATAASTSSEDSADADSVPDEDPNCEWSLWAYDWEEGAPMTNYRRVVVSWGMADWHDHHLVAKG